MAERLVPALAAAAAIICATTHAQTGTTPEDRLPRCETFDIGRNDTAIPSLVQLTLFPGTFTSWLTGRVTLGLGDPLVPVPAIPGLVGVSVGFTRLVAANWSPDNNFLAEPMLLLPDPSQASIGSYNFLTGELHVSLYLTTAEGGLPVPMPLDMSGSISNGRLFLDGSNDQIPDGGITVFLRGPEIECRKEVYFSTEVGFTSPTGSGGFTHVSDGDLLSDFRCVVKTNNELTMFLGFMPVVPDLGLDGIANAPYGPTLFSIEVPQFSETLGPISDGDLLSDDGRIIRTNRQLLADFWPLPPNTDAGLDAAHFGLVRLPVPNLQPSALYFSTEVDFWAEGLKTTVGHGDALSEKGEIIKRNRDLLAPFVPLCDIMPCQFDFGLDALYIHEDGEIWFSVETSFVSGTVGFVGEGDILSDRGYIVARNLALLTACAPLEDLGDFGLDGADINRCPRCHIPCPADFDGDGRVGSMDLAMLLGAWGPFSADSRFDLNGDGFVGSGDLALLLGSWGLCP